MNKNYLIIGAVIIGIIVIAAGGWFFINQSQSDDAMMAETMNEQEKIMDDKQAMTENEMMMTESSNYIEYTSTALGETSDSKRVLFFYANWCPTCRPVDTELRENSAQIPAGVSVIRVNYNDPETDDEEAELAKTYGISYQHTFVQIDENGNEVTKWNGGGFEEILENVK